MQESKKWFTSWTIWSVVLMLAPTVAQIIGFPNLVPILQDKQITGDEILQIIAALWAIYNRINATKQLTILPQTKV